MRVVLDTAGPGGAVRAVALDVEPPVAFTIARTADEMRDVAAWLLAAADAAERPQAVTKG